MGHESVDLSMLETWRRIEPDYRRFSIAYEGFYSALEPLYRVKRWSVYGTDRGEAVREWSPREGTGASIEAAIAESFRREK